MALHLHTLWGVFLFSLVNFYVTQNPVGGFVKETVFSDDQILCEKGKPVVACYWPVEYEHMHNVTNVSFACWVVMFFLFAFRESLRRRIYAYIYKICLLIVFFGALYNINLSMGIIYPSSHQQMLGLSYSLGIYALRTSLVGTGLAVMVFICMT